MGGEVVDPLAPEEDGSPVEKRFLVLLTGQHGDRLSLKRVPNWESKGNSTGATPPGPVVGWAHDEPTGHRTVRPHRPREHPGDLRRRRSRRDAPGPGRRGPGHAARASASTTSTPPPPTATPSCGSGPGCPSTGTASSSPPRPGERQGDRARRQLERSLERLQVDHVDLDPAPQPGRAGRVGDRPRPRRRRRGAGPGAGRGPGPPHRGDRPRHPHRRHAPAQPRAVRLRLGAAAVQLRRPPGPGLPGRRRAAPRRLRRAPGGGADHQGHRPAPLARRLRRPSLQLVPAAGRGRRHRPGRALGARATRRCS